jgi:hypothetical protein
VFADYDDLMADPVGRADYNAGETVAVPSSANTESVSLAWSSGNDVPDVRNMPANSNVPEGDFGEKHGVAGEPADVDQTWMTAWSRAAAVLLTCLALAIVIVVVGWVMSSKAPDNASAPGTTAASVRTTAPTATTIDSTPDQDSNYIAALNDKGIEFSNPTVAVSNGKAACQSFAAGMTAQQIAAEFRDANKDHPEFSTHAEAFVAVSVRAYCPQYSKLVASY